MVLELLHGQIKEQIVPRLGCGLVLWWFLGFFPSASPQFWIPKAGGDLGMSSVPGAQNPEQFLPCLCLMEKRNRTNSLEGSSVGFLAFLRSYFGSRSASLGEFSFTLDR